MVFLFTADFATFNQYKGLGPAKYTQFQAMLEISKRYLAETMKKGDVFSNPDSIRLYLSSYLRDQYREIFLLCFWIINID